MHTICATCPALKTSQGLCCRCIQAAAQAELLALNGISAALMLFDVVL